jgi:hypothetical protein
MDRSTLMTCDYSWFATLLHRGSIAVPGFAQRSSLLARESDSAAKKKAGLLWGQSGDG